MSVDDICKEAGFTREDHPDIFDDVRSEIESKLNSLMARLSATMGLTYERVEIYAKQEQMFVEDLKQFVANGRTTNPKG